MATGAEFFAQLEKRFNQLPAEEKLDKIVEYQKKLTALKEQGLSEEEAVAQLESELPLPSPVPPENDEYGRISHPKKPLVTGTLYAVALAAVVAAAGLLLRLSQNAKIKGDAAIAMISSGALAVGIVVISVTTGMNTEVSSYMFGSVLAMTKGDVALSVILSVTVLAL